MLMLFLSVMLRSIRTLVSHRRLIIKQFCKMGLISLILVPLYSKYIKVLITVYLSVVTHSKAKAFSLSLDLT
ncbi:hypothetical protein THIOM_004498 [Candidatus Thiomargarita nelsonii]|uniref:Uncharacterized protein n=1 Tax=Candidatus Thiomargarita nelsonii TaxID=1003181 RepID=A0A176RVT6_9GAMM|nr:hypothetical protein THIOM_004498 [Candidatus Thiomargarita nelsonii]